MLEFNDDWMAILKAVATDCVTARAASRAEYDAALKVYRASNPPHPGEQMPLELSQLGNPGRQILVDHVQKRWQQLGDQAFFHLDDYICSDEQDAARRTRANTKQNSIEGPTPLLGCLAARTDNAREQIASLSN